jgi:hypothetical protein
MLIYNTRDAIYLFVLYYLVALQLLNIHSHPLILFEFQHSGIPPPNSASPPAVKLKEKGIHLLLFL